MFAVWLTHGAPLRARPLDLTGHDWEGLTEFSRAAREELGDPRVIATGTLDYDDLHKEDGVIVVHPERSLDVDSLAAFMSAGGRVVLLDDYGTGDSLLRHFRIERVPLPEHPADVLRNNPQLAIAEPASAHPVVRDVTRLVTNHATGLRHHDLSPVLKVRGENEPDVLFALAGAVGRGRFLAVGDGSILMNAMLGYPGNRAFARAIARYAVEDDNWGRREGRLIVVSGAFEQHGAFGSDTAMSREWRERLRDVRDLFANTKEDGVPPAFAYLLAIVIGLSIVLWVGSKAGRVHKALIPRFTRPTPLVAHGGVAGHAAVIGAPRTSRALAMLELKSAIEETFANLLNQDAVPPPDVLVRQIEAAQLLDADGLRRLRQLLLRMASIETMVLSRRADAMDRVRDREVVEALVTTTRILEEARSASAEAASPGARPTRRATALDVVPSGASAERP